PAASPPSTIDASWPYSDSSSGPLRTRSGASRARNSSTRVEASTAGGTATILARCRVRVVKTAPLEDLHEWVSFEDPDEQRTWVWDVTFLTSSWTCIFGCGCEGVLTGPAADLVQGCCSYGAHFTSGKDRRRVERLAKKLTAD